VKRIALFLLLAAIPAAAEPDLELLRRPINTAISLPLGQGLDLIHAAEPLGQGRFRLRLGNRSTSVSVPDLGRGSSYTGLYGLGYGIRPDVDLSLLVPFFMDSAGGLTKYGTGDLALGVKWARPAQVPANTYTAIQVLIGLPLGFKGQTGLDQFQGGYGPSATSPWTRACNWPLTCISARPPSS